MKRLVIALLLLTLTAGSAQALDTREIVALAAMPLAVAAVSDISGVPTQDLVSVVSAMNRAAVPAPQFVEIVRYTPVALVDTRVEPRFATYVNTQADRGLWGDAFALSLADRLEMYDLEPAYGVREVNVVRPAYYQPSYVVEREYIPAYVTTRMQPRTIDPLALIAMPLAVAAVSELAGVPQSDLFGLIASLNQAYVPAPQFVEIVRYAPVMMVDRDPTFVRYVRTEVDRGIYGDRLVRLIDDRFDRVGYADLDFFEPEPARVIVRRQEFVPRVVVDRVVEVSRHPHGGSPGQLKKDLDLKTGAEIVHGSHPGSRRSASSRVVVDRDRDDGRRRAARSRGDDGDDRRRSTSAGRAKRDDGDDKVKRQKERGRSNQVMERRGGGDNRQLKSGGSGRREVASSRSSSREKKVSRGSARRAAVSDGRDGGKGRGKSSGKTRKERD